MAEEPKKDNVKSVFNNAFEYLFMMSALEKAMIQAKVDRDFPLLDEVLDNYWIMLSEWFTPEEDILHDKLREEEKNAHKQVLNAIQAGKISIPTELVEVYVKRWKNLLKTFHEHDLRNPNFNVEEEHGLLARRAKLNPGRQWQ